MSVRKSLCRWELAGFLIVGAVGTLLQFLYQWTGENTLVAAFSAVNESTWEHMKMLYVPYFAFTMVEFTVFGEPFRNFFAAKAAAGLAGLLTIPTLFYTIGGMFGEPPAWMNIAIFFAADAVLFLLGYRLLTALSLRGTAFQIAGFALLWALMFAFVYFTYRPPRLPLFRDPTEGGYGVAS
ncbi:MAG: hypothetical protein E7422_00670 [Ruminococcaceae bacterium]|nr:hypothetical protein [Oscillospiraceae bacterium]